MELVLAAADHGLIGTAHWRDLAYQYGGFWSGLLGDWQPKYPLQPALMFLTYPLLHAGAIHLVSNMLVLLLVGRPVLRRMEESAFLALYLVSGVGGGIGFALLGDPGLPMVGASGALFGLVGALKRYDWQMRRASGVTRGPVYVDILALILLNAVFAVVENGLLAWQAHLGGFVAGWVFAALHRPTTRPA